MTLASMLLSAAACVTFAACTVWIAVAFRGKAGRACAIAFMAAQLALAALVTTTLATSVDASPKDALVMLASVMLALSALATPPLLRRLLKAADEERDELQAQGLAEQLQAQERHRDEMRASLEQARALRDDLRAQARRALAELDGQGGKGCGDAARALEAAGADVRAKSMRLCPNPVVDALLAMKAQACDERGISWRFEAPLPEDLPLGSAQACAAYANLLDNAIHACEAMPEGQRAVSLQTHVTHGMLVARVRNSCPAGGDGGGAHRRRHERAHGLAEHGWGLVILEELARTHDGELTTCQEDGTFVTTLVLNLADVTERAA